MKNIFRISVVILLMLSIFLIHSCKKEDVQLPSEIIFNSNLSYGTLTDIDGNAYKTITIGTQIWIAENLKTTRYFNGTNIPLVNTTSKWDALSITDKAYCWQSDNLIYKDVYGALYTWGAAMNGDTSSDSIPSKVQGVCPTGWHLPSNAEWAELKNYLGDYAGSKMKEAGTTHWQSSNEGATNESGFTGLPGGMRYIDEAFHGQLESGAFEPIGGVGSWWSSTENGPTKAYNQTMTSWYSNLFEENHEKQSGLSVRCIKDN